eukprot:m.41427 g.41427  ORF g.41427 m.41427 type:complete len:110 (+) comp10424_c0_seq2:621-950(+)
MRLTAIKARTNYVLLDMGRMSCSGRVTRVPWRFTAESHKVERVVGVNTYESKLLRHQSHACQTTPFPSPHQQRSNLGDPQYPNPLKEQINKNYNVNIVVISFMYTMSCI